VQIESIVESWLRRRAKEIKIVIWITITPVDGRSGSGWKTSLGELLISPYGREYWEVCSLLLVSIRRLSAY
jgi:hypothetical protein